MTTICPSILATTLDEYQSQIAKILHDAHRIQIDLTDGIFARTTTIKPEEAWWPVGFKADFHLMYKHPLPAVKTVVRHKPNLVIIHAESDGIVADIAKTCQDNAVKLGIALLPQTSSESVLSSLDFVDHVLIFSGDLGNFGGQADLGLLEKVTLLKSLKPDLEIGWDGGVNDLNISELISGGVDVLDVGGYLQQAENPAKAFATLQRIADETGTN